MGTDRHDMPGEDLFAHQTVLSRFEHWAGVQPHAVALIDVDKFKSYNDVYGHPAGDAALQQVASILDSQSRSTDLVARYGGEVFVIVLTATDEAAAAMLGERFRRGIERAEWHDRAVTVSIGLASATGPDADGPALLAAADAALYRAKETGRNVVVAD